MKPFLTRMFVILAVLLAATQCCFAQCQYIITDLGTLGGSYGYARDINDLGQIVGYAQDSAGRERAFLYSDGTMKDLGTLGGETSCAYGINNAGQIVGSAKTSNGYDRAFLYNQGGSMSDLGTLGGETSCAYGINNAGQIVGSANTNSYREYAFLYNSTTGMQNLGTLSGYSNSRAYGINDNCQVVGSLGVGASPFFWQNETGMQDIGTFGGKGGSARSINNLGQVVGSTVATVNFEWYYHSFLCQGAGPKQDLGLIPSFGEQSVAFCINNKGQIVGSGSNVNSSSNQRAFVRNSDDGQMQDLNNLVSSSSGWTLKSANSINDNGQIVGNGYNSITGKDSAFLLTPVGKCQSFQVQQPTCTPIERLAKWDGANWIPVTTGELSNANVHVLVHGWGPGLKTFAENGGKIWDTSVNTGTGQLNNDQANLLTNAAKAIYKKAPGDMVIAFNWLDESATNDYTNPKSSRNNTDSAASELTFALKNAGISAGSFTGKIQLMGMSHGARVATLATEIMYNNGKTGDSLVVNQLTLGDSPEISFPGAYNNLLIELRKLSIGRTPGTTFVDNYYSQFGCEYSLSSDPLIPSIVNVKLDPQSSDLGDKHTYPTLWYTGATNETENLGLAWSPLVSSMCQTLSPYYEQDWTTSEYALKDTTLNHIPGGGIYITKNLVTTTLLKNGVVADLINGVNLEEHSPAYWHASFSKDVNDTTLEFSYQFLNPGDGDQLGIWIDDELRFIITGSLAGTNIFTSDIDISDLDSGYHILSVALHSYGDVGCSVNVTDFTMISVPEPSMFLLLIVGVISIFASLKFCKR